MHPVLSGKIDVSPFPENQIIGLHQANHTTEETVETNKNGLKNWFSQI